MRKSTVWMLGAAAFLMPPSAFAATSSPATGSPSAATSSSVASKPLDPVSGTIELQDYRFADGETLPSLKLHYLTLGAPKRDAEGHVTNAVLLLHGTTGTADSFLAPSFAGPLFGTGAPFDLAKVYLVIPDGIGVGGSSKPSDGLHAHFPRYGYKDQVNAQHEVLARLGATHPRLVLGTSMGGMQTWLWAETYPKDADGFVAIASTPTQISGRNEIWREMISQAIRDDPDWKGGDYTKDHPPRDWIRAAMPLFSIMTTNADVLQRQAPTRAAAVALVDKIEAGAEKRDANDFLYQFESSYDYDPAPNLAAITGPMLTINFADDLLNPVELLHLPLAANYSEFMLPAGPNSYGHETLIHASSWAPALEAFLAKLPPRR